MAETAEANETTTRPAMGLVDRMAHCLRDPAGSTGVEIAATSEARLLFYAFAGSIIYTMAAIGAETLNPSVAIGAAYEEWVATQVVIGTFFRPLGLYLVAAAIGWVCKVAGGSGSWIASRTAVFWTALCAAPPALGLDLVGALAVGYGGAPDGFGALLHGAGSVLWAFLLAEGLRMAHGFRSRLLVLASLATPALLLAAIAVVAPGGP